MSLLTTQAMTSVNRTPRSAVSPQRSWTSLWLFCVALTMIATGLPAYAANREIIITAPASAVAGSTVNVVVGARTDFGGGEHVGFLHADYSTDGGVTWTAISYSTKAGPKVSRATTFAVKEASSKAIIRVRVAFRGGKAGDVDHLGKTIAWTGSWNNWQEPPAKFATIAVVAK
jgi:hypothetical protein